MKLTPGSVYQRQDGRWYYKFTIIRHDGSRQRRSGSCGPLCTSRRAARAALDDAKFRITTTAAPAPRSAPAIQAAANAYLAHKRLDISPRHYRDIEDALTRFQAHIGPRAPIGAITAQHRQSYADQRLQTIRPISVNKDIRNIRAFLAWCAAPDQGWCAPTLAQDFKPLPIQRALPAVAPLDDLRQFIAALISPHHKSDPARRHFAHDLYLTCYHLGCRFAEAAGLRRDQIDIPRRAIRIERTKTGIPRLIPIPAALNPILQRRLAAIPAEPSALLFGNPRTGQRVTSIKTALRRAANRAGLTYVPNFKILRHTANSLIGENATPQIGASIAGHSIEVFDRWYNNARLDTMRAALDALPAVAPSVAQSGPQCPPLTPSVSHVPPRPADA